MRLASKVVVVLVLAVGVTLASSGISRTVSATVPGIMGCEKSCQVAAAGWPLPYVIDYPGPGQHPASVTAGQLCFLDVCLHDSCVAAWRCNEEFSCMNRGRPCAVPSGAAAMRMVGMGDDRCSAGRCGIAGWR